MNDKLQRGLKQLAEAGHDKGKLGMALILLHGALEEYFRDQLRQKLPLMKTNKGGGEQIGRICSIYGRNIEPCRIMIVN